MLRPRYPLTTDRLELRPFRDDDLDVLCEMDGDAETTRYLYWGPRTRAEVRTSLARLMERLGMRREAHLLENEYVKGEWVGEYVYALLADEWRATTGSGG